jgi:hypothetical protein
MCFGLCIIFVIVLVLLLISRPQTNFIPDLKIPTQSVNDDFDARW